MSVTQLGNHISENVKQQCLALCLIYNGPVFLIHSVPVEAKLLFGFREKAVMLIHDAPQRLEITARCIGELILLDAADECERQDNI